MTWPETIQRGERPHLRRTRGNSAVRSMRSHRHGTRHVHVRRRPPRPSGTASPGQRIRDVLERIRLAEEVGLDYVGIGEHHRPDYAISSPSTVIAAALAQTSRITVGSAVTVLSTEDPVRVYQQFATMDLLSAGPRRAARRPRLVHRVLPAVRGVARRLRRALRREDPAAPAARRGRAHHVAGAVPARRSTTPWSSPARSTTPAAAAPAHRRRDRRQPAVVGARRAARAAHQLRDHRRPAGPVRPARRPVPPRARAVRARRRRRRSCPSPAWASSPTTARRPATSSTRTGWSPCAGSPRSAGSRCPTGSPTSRRRRAAARTSSASPSRSPSGSSPCTACCTTTGRRSRWTCPGCRRRSRCGPSSCWARRSRRWCARRSGQSIRPDS